MVMILAYSGTLIDTEGMHRDSLLFCRSQDSAVTSEGLPRYIRTQVMAVQREPQNIKDLKSCIQ